MFDFLLEMLALLPFLFVTYLALEALEARAGNVVERFLSRDRALGPAIAAFAGAIPQCGVSAMAASFYAGGVLTVGTLVAILLSTSDELLPVLLSARVPVSLVVKIVGLKIAAALGVGFICNGVLTVLRHIRREVRVQDLCAHSHCGCHEHRGILVPALIHTGEIFLFIVLVSGILEWGMHNFGEEWLSRLQLTRPIIGELVAGAIGLVPNCAVSVAGARLYLAGAMSPGALMASSLTGSGLGLLVLFRTNRNLGENLAILATVYFSGVLLGLLMGPLI